MADEEEWTPLSAEQQTSRSDEDQEQQISARIRDILNLIGENPQREGLIKTPLRVARAMKFLTSGYHEDPVAILNSAKFNEDYRQMVIVRDINFYSLCEHHMLPFYGRVHVAYIPNGQVTGLSKIPRAVAFALPARNHWLQKTRVQLESIILLICLVLNVDWHTNQCCIFLLRSVYKMHF